MRLASFSELPPKARETFKLHRKSAFVIVDHFDKNSIRKDSFGSQGHHK